MTCVMSSMPCEGSEVVHLMCRGGICPLTGVCRSGGCCGVRPGLNSGGLCVVEHAILVCAFLAAGRPSLAFRISQV
jgi:hypothetical protein